MIEQYRQAGAPRRTLGIPPLPLTRQQVVDLTLLLEDQHEEGEFLVDLLANRVEPGVGQGAHVKAQWLELVALGRIIAPLVPPEAAVAMLGQMGGGYNVSALARLLSNQAVAAGAAAALKGLIKIYEAFDQVADMADANPYALEILKNPRLPRAIPWRKRWSAGPATWPGCCRERSANPKLPPSVRRIPPDR